MANKTAKVEKTQEEKQAEFNAKMEELLEGKTKSAAFDALFLAGYKSKDHQQIWKLFGSKIRGGIFQATLDWLAESDRTQFDLAKFVIENGTKNEARWFGQRDAVRRLSIVARATKDYKEVPLSDTQKAALKAIVEG